MNKYIQAPLSVNYDKKQTEARRQRQRTESEQRPGRMCNTADKRAGSEPEEVNETIHKSTV